MPEHLDRPAESPRQRLPPWLRTRFDGGRSRHDVRALLRELHLHTVCESAQCPNLCECWRRHAATFLLLGDVCTRNCRFCAVSHGVPEAPDPDEPARVLEAVRRLGLRFAVLTCVTRDDLADGGAAHLAAVIHALRGGLPHVGIELLASDFGGRLAAVDTVLEARPDVFNHNLETTERLTPLIRDRADYHRSLRMLAHAAERTAAAGSGIRVKSGLMLGMGERPDEVHAALRDLRRSGVSVLTLGQYLPPSASHWPLDRYVTPDEFREWDRVARQEIGFAVVVSGPLVRSSYLAESAAAATAAGMGGLRHEAEDAR